MKIKMIVSGGQTGADRAALDWAIENNILHGGWCPKGRLSEDGAIPECYQLKEHQGGYRQRTKANVKDSDATLIVSLSENLTGGSWQTLLFAKSLGRPYLHLHPECDWTIELASWLDKHQVKILNVAGPRGSKAPEVEAFVHQVLNEAFK